jgi:hypothetical protein
LAIEFVALWEDSDFPFLITSEIEWHEPSIVLGVDGRTEGPPTDLVAGPRFANSSQRRVLISNMGECRD